MRNKEAIHRKHLLHAAVLLALAAVPPAAYAAVSATNGNFTMLDSTGVNSGGTNDVTFTWDGTLNTDPNMAVINATIASPTAFFGLLWTAYDVKIYGPGSYTISTADTRGEAGCPYGMTNCAGDGGSGGAPGTYNVTVANGQIMGHMKFAWGITEGIDVIDVWAPGNWNTLNPDDIITTADATTVAGGTYVGPVYSLLSIDWDGDGDAGAGMLDGPFKANGGFSANFSLNSGGNVTPTCPPSCPPPETNITASEPSTAGGCSISTNPVNPIERGDWWLVAGFLAWMGALRKRFRRQAQS